MFWDHSISREEWHALPPEEKRKRRIAIRAYFLKQNGMPGTDRDRLKMARFEDQFNDEFYQMECKRSSFAYVRMPREESMEKELRLLLAEHLTGILRTSPKKIGDATELPKDMFLLLYVAGRVNFNVLNKFDQATFLDCGTVGELIAKLMEEYRQKYSEKARVQTT
jgi:hypothetical protein